MQAAVLSTNDTGLQAETGEWGVDVEVVVGEEVEDEEGDEEEEEVEENDAVELLLGRAELSMASQSVCGASSDRDRMNTAENTEDNRDRREGGWAEEDSSD